MPRLRQNTLLNFKLKNEAARDNLNKNKFGKGCMGRNSDVTDVHNLGRVYTSCQYT